MPPASKSKKVQKNNYAKRCGKPAGATTPDVPPAASALPRSTSQSIAMTRVALLASVANAPDGTPYGKPSHQARPPPGLSDAHYSLGPSGAALAQLAVAASSSSGRSRSNSEVGDTRGLDAAPPPLTRLETAGAEKQPPQPLKHGLRSQSRSVSFSARAAMAVAEANAAAAAVAVAVAEATAATAAAARRYRKRKSERCYTTFGG